MFSLIFGNSSSDSFRMTDDVMLAFIEMGTLYSCLTPPDVVFMQPGLYQPRSMIGSIFRSYLDQENYDMLKLIVQACPAVFRYHCCYPNKRLNEAFFSNIVIKCGMDANVIMHDDLPRSGKTALTVACSEILDRNVRMLLEAGANVNLQDSKRSTCLHYLAVGMGKFKEKHPLERT